MRRTPANEPPIALMLSAADKKIREAQGLLSRLYRLTLYDLNITPYKWTFLLNLYLDRLSQTREMTHDMVQNERNNLKKGLSDTDMTFDMFTRGIDFLDAKEARFGVILEFEPDSVAPRVEVSVNLFECDYGEPAGNLGTLSWMYRQLLAPLGKDVTNLNAEIDAYLSNPLVRAELKGRKRGNDKGNLRRELPGEDMTWEVFKKGLRVLAPIKTEIYLELTHTRRRKTRHFLVINTPRMS